MLFIDLNAILSLGYFESILLGQVQQVITKCVISNSNIIRWVNMLLGNSVNVAGNLMATVCKHLRHFSMYDARYQNPAIEFVYIGGWMLPFLITLLFTSTLSDILLGIVESRIQHGPKLIILSSFSTSS